MRFHDEDGQALILALAFLVFFGLVIAAILSFAEGSVLATERLREQRAAAYAADAATDAAIQYARFNPGVGGFGANPCMRATPFSITTPAPNATTATVDCRSLAAPTDLDRTVQFTASVDGVPLVVATVFFYDSTATGGLPPGTLPAFDVQSWTYCRSTPCP